MEKTKNRSKWIWIASAVLTGLVLIGCSTGSPSGNKEVDNPSSTSSQVGTSGNTSAPKEAHVLKAADIKLAVRVTSKQCFGSAGCSVAWKLNVTVDKTKLSEGNDWAITYMVQGVEDGPFVSTFNLYGNGTYDADTGFGSTSSTNKTLTASVSGIERL